MQRPGLRKILFCSIQSILEKIVQYHRQDPMEIYKILQDPRQSYKILQDPLQNLMESSSLLNSIYVQDLRQDSEGLNSSLWNIKQDNNI